MNCTDQFISAQEDTKCKANGLLSELGFDMQDVVYTRPDRQALVGTNVDFSFENIDFGLFAALNEQDIDLGHFDPDAIDIDAINPTAFAPDLSRAFDSYEGTLPEFQPTNLAGVDEKNNVSLFDLSQSGLSGIDAYHNNAGIPPTPITSWNNVGLQNARAAAILGTGPSVHHVPQAFDPMPHVQQATQYAQLAMPCVYQTGHSPMHQAQAVYIPWYAQQERELEAIRNVPSYAVQQPHQANAPAETWASLLDFETKDNPDASYKAPQQPGKIPFTPPHATFCPVQEAGRAEGFLFDSLEEAIAAHPPPNWRCPINDPTIPATDEDRASWVSVLLDSINNTTNVLDTPGAMFAKRWYHPVTGPSTFHSEEDKETACWDILDLAERLHRMGPCVLHSFDNLFWNEAKKTKAWTFQQRMEQIVLLLKVSKGRCESLLANETSHAIVGYPSALLSAASNNAKCNRARQAILEAGRVVKKPKLER